MQVEEQIEIFNQIRTRLKAYEPPYKARMDIQGRYELWAEGEFEAFGKRRNEVFFGGLIIQSNYVGFYFMPV